MKNILEKIKLAIGVIVGTIVGAVGLVATTLFAVVASIIGYALQIGVIAVAVYIVYCLFKMVVM